MILGYSVDPLRALARPGAPLDGAWLAARTSCEEILPPPVWATALDGESWVAAATASALPTSNEVSV